MAKFVCPCGQVIAVSGLIPNPIEWLLISDMSYDQLGSTVDADTLYKSMVHAFRCPRSGHLFVYWDGLIEQATLYEPRGKHG